MAKKLGDIFGNMDEVFANAKIPDFDEVLSRTRTFTEEVSKKSAERIEISRKKVECLDIKAKLAKAYEKFGRLEYAVYSGETADENVVASVASDIAVLLNKLNCIMAELDAAKNEVDSKPADSGE